MDPRETLFSAAGKLFVIFVSKEDAKDGLSPAADLVDWYNNQILSKSLVSGQISTLFGATTLIATNGLLPFPRILVFGLGQVDDVGAAEAKDLVKLLDQCLEGLEETSPWLVFPRQLPEKFESEFQKSRTSVKRLAHAKIFEDET